MSSLTHLQAFEDLGHIYFRLPSYSPFLNDAQWVFGHIKSHVWWNDLQDQWTLLGHINDNIQEIIADMVQGWRREVNQKFSRASCGDELRESHTCCTVLCEIRLYNSWYWFCEVVNMGAKSWNCPQDVVKLAESSS